MVAAAPVGAKGRRTLGRATGAWSARTMDDPSDQAEPAVDRHDEDIDGDGALDATITVTSSHPGAADDGVGADLEVVRVEEIDLDGDGSPDIVATTTTTYLDRNHDGLVDEIQETTVTRTDLDGDGVVDIVDVVATTSRDVDHNGVLEVVEQWEATGVDLDGDGVIDSDEITIDHVSQQVAEHGPEHPTGHDPAAGRAG